MTIHHITLHCIACDCITINYDALLHVTISKQRYVASPAALNVARGLKCLPRFTGALHFPCLRQHSSLDLEFSLEKRVLLACALDFFGLGRQKKDRKKTVE
jgi:hypothetical protein